MTGKPYNTPPSSSYQPYTSGPSQYNTNTNAPSYNKPPVSSYPSTNTGAQGNAGGYQPPQPAGNYNAGAMNRQTSQPMYNYYDRNIPPVRQPPVGQNSFDNRGAVPQQNMPNSHGPRYGAPSNYKPLEYGPQGISRSSNMTYSSSPSNGGVTRPHLTYKDQPMNNYYTRQPAYQ
ncbi:hypothetical protein EB796_009237 [Bugula neritina]|uniref:Uncharacterized protein n=1 Tax=Bugula neritina TaxID=10212 RepID=A0A7J7K2K7_BUGNE|nr:hypothetical protein EB796_009237 [Bugula neritina]